VDHGLPIWTLVHLRLESGLRVENGLWVLLLAKLLKLVSAVLALA